MGLVRLAQDIPSLRRCLHSKAFIFTFDLSTIKWIISIRKACEYFENSESINKHEGFTWFRWNRNNMPGFTNYDFVVSVNKN
jgi:hypothetical protein